MCVDLEAQSSTAEPAGKGALSLQGGTHPVKRKGGRDPNVDVDVDVNVNVNVVVDEIPDHAHVHVHARCRDPT